MWVLLGWTDAKVIVFNSWLLLHPVTCQTPGHEIKTDKTILLANICCELLGSR